MASRGMSLKTLLPLPAAVYRFDLAVLRVAAALGFCRSWVKTNNNNEKKKTTLTRCTACS